MILSYVIYETQSDGNGNTTHLPPCDKINENEAWGEYYLRLAYAANSTVPVHTVMLATIDGRLIQKKSFFHTEVPNDEN